MSLEQDYTTVPGQVFACLSIVGPECPQKNDKFGIKIRGTFANRDEAANHAKRLQKEDPTFDIYVVDMYKWLLIPPDSSKIEDVHYTNDKLEEIMTVTRRIRLRLLVCLTNVSKVWLTRLAFPLVTTTPPSTRNPMRLPSLTQLRF